MIPSNIFLALVLSTYQPKKNNQNIENPKNLLSLLIKKYIWTSKFKTSLISLVGLRAYLKTYLDEIKTISIVRGKADSFKEWINLYSALEAAQHATPLYDLLPLPAIPSPPQGSVPPP